MTLVVKENGYRFQETTQVRISNFNGLKSIKACFSQEKQALLFFQIHQKLCLIDKDTKFPYIFYFRD